MNAEGLSRVGRPWQVLRCFGLAAQMSVAALLLWSAITKAETPAPAKSLCRSMVSKTWCDIGMPLLVLSEWILGSWLLFFRFRVAALAAALLFVIAVTVFAWLAYQRGYSGPCGCFGGHEPASAGPTLMRNGVVMLVIAFAAAATLLDGGEPE